MTCSEACRKRREREPKGITRIVGAGTRKGAAKKFMPRTLRHGYAARMEVVMRSLSPLAEALIDQTLAVWQVPMPAGYPDEVEWRRGQARALLNLARDERASQSPSIARFNRRARIYIRHMERLMRSTTKES